MKKAKFFIKGMHCQSCATLIEERFKEINGTINAKVNQSSGKAVVIYDEDKTNKNDLISAVASAGDYQAEEVEENSEDNSKEKEEEPPLIRGKSQIDYNNSANRPNGSKKAFILGFVASVGLMSVILNIVMARALIKTGWPNNNSVKAVKANQAQNVAVNPTGQAGQTPPKATIQTFTINEKDHVRGNFNAPITLVEFSDFECPFCERHYPTLKKIMNDYKDKIRLVYKHFPLGIHPNAQKAAEASECADEQGSFWDYHDKLFENQATGYSVDKFKEWAKVLNLDAGKFNDCLDSAKYAQKVQADYQEGVTKGVNGTPATFVNGQMLSGALPYDNFKQLIDGVINKL